MAMRDALCNRGQLLRKIIRVIESEESILITENAARVFSLSSQITATLATNYSSKFCTWRNTIFFVVASFNRNFGLKSLWCVKIYRQPRCAMAPEILLNILFDNSNVAMRYYANCTARTCLFCAPHIAWYFHYTLASFLSCSVKGGI